MSVKLEGSTPEKIFPLLEKLTRKILSEKEAIEATVENDLFCVLIIYLMMENEFIPEIEDSKFLEDMTLYDIEHFSKGKLGSEVYEAQFVMCGFHDLPLKLIISRIGALMLINVIFTNVCAETYTVCLPINSYVVLPQDLTTPIIFRDLHHLSVTYKNKVLSAVKSKILSLHGYPSASLVGLPDELLMFNILLYLPIVDIISISKTCKRLKAIVGNDILWREIYKRDFKESAACVTSNWKMLYKENFLAEVKDSREFIGQSHINYINYRSLEDII